MLRWLLLCLTCLPLVLQAEAPVLYKGRFRPVEAYARLWLQEIYHAPKIKSEDLAAFETDTQSAHHLLQQMEKRGTLAFRHAPLFWIRAATTKRALGLPERQSRFSYDQLEEAFYHPLPTGRPWLYLVVTQAFLDKGEQSRGMELPQLAPGLWVRLRKGNLEVTAVPDQAPWNLLKPGDVVQRDLPSMDPKALKTMSEELVSLLQKVASFPNWELFPMLPSRQEASRFLPLGLLKQNQNLTIYSDSVYSSLQAAYPGDLPEVERVLAQAYQAELAGKVYQSTAQKQLRFPSPLTLKAEALYYHYPLVEVAIGLYGIAFVLAALRRYAFSATLLAFLFHTGILALRCFILGRPPVSNMFETVLYVPWICVLLGLGLRQALVLIAANLGALGLLAVLKLTQLDGEMENVQAVLDSQYWLIIHVLMVVGSYGVFLLSSLLAHAYLIRRWLGHPSATLADLTLKSCYLGAALLIPGTVLGGVWAAESWGRFWDWDPKESWAFISSCVYLVVIHLYRFRLVRERGLAVGTALGFLVISFTWYGVNYILGTGLHSYGFGSGEDLYYYSFVIADLGLIACLGWLPTRPSGAHPKLIR